ncbi:YjbH domain-containing protein [Halioxenophilus aromaticivorans]
MDANFKRSLSGRLAFTILLTASAHALGSASNYGTTGLATIPSAYMAEDAALSFSASSVKDYDYYNLTYQAFPWLEATFRYRRVKDVTRNIWTDYYDRNFAAKVRLIEEGYYTPQVSTGMRDFVGTGLVGAEYIVASKNVGSFEVHFGLGWGDLAGDDNIKNPLTNLRNSFSTRQDNGNRGNQAGTIPTGSAFQGEHIGWFGGIKYRIPKLPVNIFIERNPEYNRNDVRNFGIDKPSSDISIGAEWQPTPNLSIGTAYQQGDNWSVKFDYKVATNRRTTKQKTYYRNLQSLISNARSDNWYVNLLTDMENEGLLLVNGSLTGDEQKAQLTIGNTQYRNWDQAIDLATSLADLNLPPTVKTIEFTVAENGYAARTITVTRPTFKVLTEQLDTLKIYPDNLPTKNYTLPDYATNYVQNQIAFDIGLAPRIQLFDPDEPIRYGLAIGANTRVALPLNWVLNGSYTYLIDQNFDQSNRRSGSTLPHVRTDIVDYLNDTDRLQTLYVEKRVSAKNTYSRVFGGILEEMFAGIGGETLYREYNSRLAFGVSYAWVAQREASSDFGLRDYNTFTGFLSAYWATPFYNYDFAVHIGQYLAKDKGATLEVTRRFNNGWEIKAWATKTDVSSEDFGEGSFDKGIGLTMPLNAIFGSRKNTSLTIRPVQRDGGQTLNNAPGSIWNQTLKK